MPRLARLAPGSQGNLRMLRAVYDAVRWDGMQARIIRTLPAISAVFAVLILGCRMTAQEPPKVEPADGAALVRVLDHGGLCPDGRECAVQTGVLVDGSVIRQLGPGSATTSQVDSDRVQQ